MKKMDQDTKQNRSIVINEAQLLLAEKRTSLAAMRTGIAVMALPLSVLSLLIATSKHYHVFSVLHFLIPLILLNLALITLGVYLIIRSINHIRHYDRLLHQLKNTHSIISQFLD